MKKTLAVLLDDVSTELYETADIPSMRGIEESGYRVPKFIGARNCSCFRAQLETGWETPKGGNLVGGVFKADVIGYSLPKGRTLATYARAANQWGKWHLCEFSNLEHRGKLGYHKFGGTQAGIGPTGGTYYHHEVVEGNTFGAYRRTIDQYSTDYIVENALDSVLTNVELVVASFNAVHTPKHSPPGSTNTSTQAVLEYVDDAITPLLRKAVSNNYRIVIVSDNGGTTKDGGKGNLSHKALNTPCILYGFLDVEITPLMQATDLFAYITGDWSKDSMTDRDFAWADKFREIGSLPESWEWMVTDGEFKVITDATGVKTYLIYEDEPATQEQCGHLPSRRY